MLQRVDGWAQVYMPLWCTLVHIIMHLSLSGSGTRRPSAFARACTTLTCTQGNDATLGFCQETNEKCSVWTVRYTTFAVAAFTVGMHQMCTNLAKSKASPSWVKNHLCFAPGSARALLGIFCTSFNYKTLVYTTQQTIHHMLQNRPVQKILCCSARKWNALSILKRNAGAVVGGAAGIPFAA